MSYRTFKEGEALKLTLEAQVKYGIGNVMFQYCKFKGVTSKGVRLHEVRSLTGFSIYVKESEIENYKFGDYESF